MPRKKQAVEPGERMRQILSAAAARLLSGDDEGALVLAWNTLIWVWESARTLREQSGEFFVDGAAVREFLAVIRAMLRDGLPREAAKELEKPDES